MVCKLIVCNTSSIYSNVIYLYICTTVVILQCFLWYILLEKKSWMIQGSPRTPDRLPELSGSHVRLSEVWKTMMSTCGPYNLGGSTIAGIKACHCRSIVVLLYKTSKCTTQMNFKPILVKRVTSDLPSVCWGMSRHTLGVQVVCQLLHALEYFNSYSP